MQTESFRTQAESIYQQAAEKAERIRKDAANYAPSVERERVSAGIERLKAETRGNLAALELKMSEAESAAQAELAAYRFPLNVAPVHETTGDRLLREQAKMQAVAVAYSLPLFDAQAVEAMLDQGLRHLAFTFMDRNLKAEVPEKLSAQREVWDGRIGNLLRKDPTHAGLMQRLKATTGARERIVALSHFVDAGDFTPVAKMSPDQARRFYQ